MYNGETYIVTDLEANKYGVRIIHKHIIKRGISFMVLTSQKCTSSKIDIPFQFNHYDHHTGNVQSVFNISSIIEQLQISLEKTIIKCRYSEMPITGKKTKIGPKFRNSYRRLYRGKQDYHTFLYLAFKRIHLLTWYTFLWTVFFNLKAELREFWESKINT